MLNHNLIFLDFEASSLAADSWPIEIGLSHIAAGEVMTWASLISPRIHWPMTAWSPQSAGVHGIPKREVLSAAAADEVAREVLGRIEGSVLVCDAPDFDARWLGRLLEGFPTRGITVADFDYVAAQAFPESILDWVYEGLERRHVSHRAGPDSARLAGAWLDGLKRLEA